MMRLYQAHKITKMVKAFAGRYCLPYREENIIKQVLEGKTNAVIASSLNISTESVKKALQKIFLKTGCGNRVELSVSVMCEEEN